jgi:predicted glycosyltransferase
MYAHTRNSAAHNTIEKCMGNCRRAIRVPCTSSGFEQPPRNQRENTLGIHSALTQLVAQMSQLELLAQMTQQ